MRLALTGGSVSTIDQTGNYLWSTLLPSYGPVFSLRCRTSLYLIGTPICLHCDGLHEQMAADLNSEKKNATPELFLVKKRKPAHDARPLRDAGLERIP